ncbi:AlpA family phage regulatory protein [Paraburkholderia sp. C35]|uniref:helix-turn-helix transcriptional regulator n=1 Tax=Paraburkholderia sp. C35 TaxID=2126993 RepID=UPI000D69EB46|nr:AlpA family phage regulatory protein [Paraburkholderia sp. C35]
MNYEIPSLLEKTAFLREKQLVGDAKKQIPGLLPFSRATLWRRVKEGSFPAPIKLSERTTAWSTADIRKWIVDPTGYKAS